MINVLKNNVAVELIQKEKVTLSGIVLSSADPSEANKGTVVAVGPDVTMVKVGDTVLPNWNASKGKFTHEDQDLWIIPETEIVGIFE
jgi:co-chaperonin GroES (HSP10)